MDDLISVIVPIYNVEAYLDECIESICNQTYKNLEILLIDDGSKDKSGNIAETWAKKDTRCIVYHKENEGLSAARNDGIEAAKGKYIIYGDCDSTYNFQQILPFYDALIDGADLVVGNRYAGGIKSGAMPFSHRYLGVPFLSWLGRKKYKVNIHDFHCGLRGLNAAYAKNLTFTSTGMEFATEIIAQFANSKATIKEVPATLSTSKAPRKPHLRTIRDGFRHIIYMINN